MRSLIFILLLLCGVARADNLIVAKNGKSLADASVDVTKLAPGNYVYVQSLNFPKVKLTPAHNVIIEFQPNKVAMLYSLPANKMLTTIPYPLTLKEKSCVISNSTLGFAPENIKTAGRCALNFTVAKQSFVMKWLKNPNPKKIGQILKAIDEDDTLVKDDNLMFGFGIAIKNAQVIPGYLKALVPQTHTDLVCDRDYFSGFSVIDEWTIENQVSNSMRNNRMEDRATVACRQIGLQRTGKTSYRLVPTAQKSCNLVAQNYGLSVSNSSRQCEMAFQTTLAELAELAEAIERARVAAVVPATIKSLNSLADELLLSSADDDDQVAKFKGTPFFVHAVLGLVESNSSFSSDEANVIEVKFKGVK